MEAVPNCRQTSSVWLIVVVFFADAVCIVFVLCIACVYVSVSVVYFTIISMCVSYSVHIIIIILL